MLSDDAPRFWVEEKEEDVVEQEDNAVTTVAEPPMPSIKQQREMVADSDITEENKSILNALIENNETAKLLTTIQSDETKDLQTRIIEATCTAFVQARMTNNAAAEKLKAKLLENLLENAGRLDLETQAKIYTDLTEVSAIDAQQALSKATGSSGMPGGSGSGVTVNVNTAGENSTINQNHLEVNAHPEKLKETASLNASLRAWAAQNVPRKEPKVVDAESTETKNDE